MKRIAIVGAGGMARVRARALLASGRAEIVGVASKHPASAERFANELGCPRYFDDPRKLYALRPDAVLVEVPHHAQDAIVLAALEAGTNVFIGGSLASSSAIGEKIVRLTRDKALIVEAGYDARYSACWEQAKAIIGQGRLGDLVAVRSLALWNGDPATWYYQQEASGGMPLTHMTYCFLNPVRWILGRACRVAAFANRKLHAAPDLVAEETCLTNVLFENNVPAAFTAGFVKPAEYAAWTVTFFGTKAILDVFPSEQGAGGTLMLHAGATSEKLDFSTAPNSFDVQAGAFLNALDGNNECRNPATDTLEDIRLAEAIVQSARESQIIKI